VEGVNGLAYVIIYALTDFAWIQGAVYCLLFSALLVLSVIDERTMEIPIGINIFIAVLGVFYTCYDREHLIEHIIGFFAVSLLLEIILLVSKGRAIGGGDVKLMATAGLLLGWQNIYFAFAAGCILGSALHILRMKLTGAGKTLALGPYLSMGILLAALFGQRFILWYSSLLFAGIG
jgi:leader peptidase (prepilin peptidase)/N-methyltransferase